MAIIVSSSHKLIELYIVRHRKQRLGSAENLNLFNLKFTNCK